MHLSLLSPPLKTEGTVDAVHSVTIQLKEGKLHWRGPLLEGSMR